MLRSVRVQLWRRVNATEDDQTPNPSTTNTLYRLTSGKGGEGGDISWRE